MSKPSRERSPLFNRYWKNERGNTRKTDYTPLEERDDWDGIVEVLPSDNIRGQSRVMDKDLTKPEFGEKIRVQPI